jgi:phosphoribosylformimino-5-aminoimidazole carboxamide ribotide isomerase
LAVETGKSVIASGGVSELADLRALKELALKGVSGAIVGKAIYEGRFSVPEALKEVK